MQSQNTINAAKEVCFVDNKMSSDSSTANTLSVTRLGKCEVCAASEARYCCPKCEVKTCSLPCVKIHKRELSCDGIRNRTKYVPLNKLTAREFMSDYCFLEECTRYTEARKTDRIKQQERSRGMSVPQYRMRDAARERGTKLQLLAPQFSRHKENTSYLNWKQNCFYWRVCWVFANARTPENAMAQFKEPRCNEQQTLAQLLTKYIDRQQEPARAHHRLLSHYQSAGMGQLQALLCAEGVRSSHKRYHQLELQKTLRENLAGKTIVEYPTIYVLYEQQLLDYELVDSDESADEAEAAAACATAAADTTQANKRKLAAAVQTNPKLSKMHSAEHDIYGRIAAEYSDDAAEPENSGSAEDTEMRQQADSDSELDNSY